MSIPLDYQAITWNLFAPVQSTVHDMYGWSNNQIAWLANTANIGTHAHSRTHSQARISARDFLLGARIW
jgi:hypothetical protein